MPITAQYQTYYGIHLNHWTETWASTNYNKILVKDVPDVECVSTATTACTSTVTFILPELVKGKYYLDGNASGHFHLYNWTSTASEVVSNVTVTLKAINNGGTSRDLGTYTKTLTYNLYKLDIIAVPFYLNVSKVEITENEKLALALHATTGTHISFYHDIEPTEGDMDIVLRLPYAPYSGG